MTQDGEIQIKNHGLYQVNMLWNQKQVLSDWKILVILVIWTQLCNNYLWFLSLRKLFLKFKLKI